MNTLVEFPGKPANDTVGLLIMQIIKMEVNAA